MLPFSGSADYSRFRLITHTCLTPITNDSSTSVPLTSNTEDEHYNIQEWIKGQNSASGNKEVSRIFNDILSCLQGHIDQMDMSFLEKLSLDSKLVTPFIESTLSKTFFHQLFMCVYLNYFGADRIQNISKALSLFHSIGDKNEMCANLSEDVTLKSKMDKDTAKKVITNLQNKISLDANILSAQKDDVKNQEQLFTLFTSPKLFNVETVLNEILMGLILPTQQFKSMINDFQNVSPIRRNIIEGEHKNKAINLSQSKNRLHQMILSIILPDRFKIPDADSIHALDIILNYIFKKDVSLIYKVDTLLSFQCFLKCHSLEELYSVIDQEERSITPSLTIEIKFLSLLKSTICAVIWIYAFLEANKSFLLSMSNGDYINCLKENTIYFFNNRFYIYFQQSKFSSTCYRTLLYKYVKSSPNSNCDRASSNSSIKY